MKITAINLALASAALWSGSIACAHHSYAMFDQSRRATISGTVAKLEWTNPHVFIWMYVPNPAGKHDLYALENGSVSILSRNGWTRDTLKPGEKFTMEYFPLRDGRNGGYFIKASNEAGRVITGDPGAPGGSKPLNFGPPEPGK